MTDSRLSPVSRDPFDICEMIVSEEFYLDEKRPTAFRELQSYGYAARDRIRAAKRERSGDVAASPIDREAMAKAIQQFWQGASARAWDGHEKSCCEALPGQANWFRRLADVVIAQCGAPAQEAPKPIGAELFRQSIAPAAPQAAQETTLRKAAQELMDAVNRTADPTEWFAGIGKIQYALSLAPVQAPPSQEDIRACVWLTLVGFENELGKENIKFICDQIAKRVTLSSTGLGSARE